MMGSRVALEMSFVSKSFGCWHVPCGVQLLSERCSLNGRRLPQRYNIDRLPLCRLLESVKEMHWKNQRNEMTGTTETKPNEMHGMTELNE